MQRLNSRVRRLVSIMLIGAFSATVAAAATVTATGTLTFAKRVNQRPTAGSNGNNTTSTTYAEENRPVRQAIVKAFEGSTELASGTTDENGIFSLPVTFNSAFNLVAYSSGAGVLVQKLDASENNSGTYSVVFASAVSSAGPHNATISIAQSSGAFNIYDQLVKGRDWLKARGYNFTHTLLGLWPTSTSNGTRFSPSAFALYIQQASSSSGDSDEWDDDIILHEFGHMAIEEFSVDHSKGGFHNVSGKYDMRLAWSEGVAHFISSAVRSDPINFDAVGESGGQLLIQPLDIAFPSTSAVQSTNEWAVANILWRAFQNLDTHANLILTALASFKSLPAAIKDDPVSLDTFNDQWGGASLASYYTDRSMTYAVDAISGNTLTSPVFIADPTLYGLQKLSFYANGNYDFFKFSATAGDKFVLATANATNGALTQINVYLGSNLSFLVASNAQANGLQKDATSYIDFTAPNSAGYLVQVLRFTSGTKNYGLGEDTSVSTSGLYSKTVGRYGGYSFGLQKVSSFSGTKDSTFVSTANASSGTSTVTPAATTAATPAETGGGGGGGGGCWLVAR